MMMDLTYLITGIQVRLMEEILHHLGCKEPVNNRINYLSTGAGFLPSTVCLHLMDLLVLCSLCFPKVNIIGFQFVFAN